MENGYQDAFVGVKQASTVERIVQALIGVIKSRRMRPGERLPSERELCELIGVSRPVLREALKALQVMSIVDIRQGAGAYLKPLVVEEVVEHLDIVFHLDDTLYRDLYEARRVIEGCIARLAAVRITEAELRVIKENIAQAAGSLDDPEEFYRSDLELHKLILVASGNRVVPAFMQSINKVQLMMRQRTNLRLKIRKAAIDDHRLIFKALAAHDPDAAGKAMERHIANVEAVFFNEKEEAQ